ncbi:MAG: class I SAM-dependent methyltransferase [Chloroflexi bacterium]|nr:class I SAM-dependent methyltransferase [Chloroflexota bacterium]
MSDSREARIDEIVVDLQAQIRRQRLAKGDPNLSEQPDILSRVRQTHWVNPHVPIGWPEMPKGLLNKLAVYVKKVVRRLLRWYINPLVEQQNAYNAAVSDALARLINLETDNKLLLQKITEQNWTNFQQNQQSYYDAEKQILISAIQTYMDKPVQQQSSQELNGDSQSLETLKKQLTEHDWEVIREHQRIDHTAEQKKMIEMFGKSSDYTQRALEPLRLRVQRLEAKQRKSLPQPDLAKPQVAAANMPESSTDSFVVGVQYRNEVQMAQRLSDYDDIIIRLATSASDDQPASLPVLDIGCGRGELVAHLHQLGLPAYGIDIDADAVMTGQNAGLDLRREDAFVHLGGLADNSLRAVVIIQVIEHLTLGDISRLFGLIYQKLTPNGIVIAETVNPVCLWALSNHFLLDPSHRTPLHPQMTKSILEQAGFWQVDIRLLHQVPDEERLGWVSLRTNDANLLEMDAAMRANIERLNTFLYGPQDYAAIAVKPEE